MKSRSSGAFFFGYRQIGDLIVSFFFAQMFEDVFALGPKMFKLLWKAAWEPVYARHKWVVGEWGD